MQFAAIANGMSLEYWFVYRIFNNDIEITELLYAEHGARLVRYIW
jgi:hypothetical protein